MSKKLFLISLFLLAAALITLPLEGAAAEDSYTLFKPDSSGYIYLDSPQLIASDGSSAAVYDSGLHRVALTGAINTYITDVGDLTALALFNQYLITLDSGNQLVRYDLSNGQSAVFNAGEEVIETPSLMTSCGDTFYLYNGYRTVVALSFDLTVTATYTNNLLMYSKSISADGQNIYALTFYGKLVKAELSGGSFELLSEEVSADNVAAVSGGYALLSGSGIKIASTLYSGSYSLPSSSLNTEGAVNAAVEGDTVYVLDNTNAVKVLSFTESGLIYQYSLGSSGAEIGMFSSPLDMDFGSNNRLAVADRGNNRIQILGDTPRAYNGVSASEVVWAEGVLYALNQSGRVLRLEGSSVTYVGYSETAVSLSSCGSVLFVAGAEGSIVSINQNGGQEAITKLAAAPSKIVASKTGKSVYALLGGEIAGYASIGKITSLDVSAYSVTDFTVDLSGNIYILSGGDNPAVIKFTRTYGGYLKADEIVLEHDLYDIGAPVALSMDNEGALYALSRSHHMIAKINHNFSPALSYTPQSAPAIEDYSISFGTVNNVPLYEYTDNFEYITPLTNTAVIVFNSFSDAQFYYVMTSGGSYGYVDKSAVQAGVSTVPSFTDIKMLHADGDRIYSYPAKNAPYKAVDNSLPMRITGNACNFTGGGVYWYQVSYTLNGEEKSGFVQRTRVIQYAPEQPVAAQETFAKIASQLATNVTVYYLADEQSGVVMTLADGTKVQVLEQLDPNKQFTLIYYDGQQGYVLTSCLTEPDKLTKSQLVAILIAVFMVAATSLFLAVSKNAKRLKNKT